jgi:hypothetical protein
MKRWFKQIIVYLPLAFCSLLVQCGQVNDLKEVYNLEKESK